MSYFSDLAELFIPRRCAACGGVLPQGSRFMCPSCVYDMPSTNYCCTHENPVYTKLEGLIELQEAGALMFYKSESRYREMIHDLKYHGQWRQCRELGRLLGEELKKGALYEGVDMVVPIPLHRRRMRKRGYNQAHYIAQGVASALGKPVENGAIKRGVYNPSQARTERSNRWDNVEGIFRILQSSKLEGKHILIVDDVLTTGATIVSCCQEIHRCAPTCRISIAAIAVSSYELFYGGS